MDHVLQPMSIEEEWSQLRARATWDEEPAYICGDPSFMLRAERSSRPFALSRLLYQASYGLWHWDADTVPRTLGARQLALLNPRVPRPLRSGDERGCVTDGAPRLSLTGDPSVVSDYCLPPCHGASHESTDDMERAIQSYNAMRRELCQEEFRRMVDVGAVQVVSTPTVFGDADYFSVSGSTIHQADASSAYIQALNYWQPQSLPRVSLSRELYGEPASMRYRMVYGHRSLVRVMPDDSAPTESESMPQLVDSESAESGSEKEEPEPEPLRGESRWTPTYKWPLWPNILVLPTTMIRIEDADEQSNDMATLWAPLVCPRSWLNALPEKVREA